MAQYTLTEQEVRTLAFKYANETMEHSASYYSDASKWFMEYIKKFNDAMSTIEEYNQSVES